MCTVLDSPVSTSRIRRNRAQNQVNSLKQRQGLDQDREQMGKDVWSEMQDADTAQEIMQRQLIGTIAFAVCHRRADKYSRIWPRSRVSARN